MSLMSTWIGSAFLAQAGQPIQEAAEAAASMAVESVWDFVVKGGPMMIPIGLSSLIAFTVVVERIISLRRKRVIPRGFLDGLKKELNGNPRDPKRAVAYCENDGSPVANVFAAGLKRSAGPIEVVERHIKEAGQREVLKLRKYLRVLSVIAGIAPLMGLLGTIFGMISAFQTVATSADALGKTELLAGGIYEAMITTAGGLIVAIPVLVCYHWLSAKVQNLVMDIDQMTVDFVEELVASEQASEDDSDYHEAPGDDDAEGPAALGAIEHGRVAAS